MTDPITFEPRPNRFHNLWPGVERAIAVELGIDLTHALPGTLALTFTPIRDQNAPDGSPHVMVEWEEWHPSQQRSAGRMTHSRWLTRAEVTAVQKIIHERD